MKQQTSHRRFPDYIFFRQNRKLHLTPTGQFQTSPNAQGTGFLLDRQKHTKYTATQAHLSTTVDIDMLAAKKRTLSIYCETSKLRTLWEHVSSSLVDKLSLFRSSHWVFISST